MSKLSDAIRRVQRIDAAPMGFGAARATVKATMLVGVMTPATGVKAAWENGADIVIVDARTGTLSAADVKKAAEGNSQAPLGAWQSNPDRELAAELQKAGLDFLLLTADATPAETLLVEDLAFVLALPEEAEYLFLRALEELNLDGLLLNRVPSPLTVSGQFGLN